MELYIGKNVCEPDGYKKRISFKSFEVWTKFLSNERGHYYDAVLDDVLYAVFGDLYKIEGCDNPAEICARACMDGGLDEVFDVDGDFIFIKIVEENEITILQSNYGGPNFYYKLSGKDMAFSTNASLLMDDFSETDIDDRSVCDYRLYGSMIGGNSFSKRV